LNNVLLIRYTIGEYSGFLIFSLISSKWNRICKNGAAADNLTFYPEKYIDKNVQIQ